MAHHLEQLFDIVEPQAPLARAAIFVESAKLAHGDRVPPVTIGFGEEHLHVIDKILRDIVRQLKRRAVYQCRQPFLSVSTLKPAGG
jgi:hypothetical protein